jgi:hypothetical protein
LYPDRVGGGSGRKTGSKIWKMGRGAHLHSRQLTVAGAEEEKRRVRIQTKKPVRVRERRGVPERSKWEIDGSSMQSPRAAASHPAVARKVSLG